MLRKTLVAVAVALPFFFNGYPAEPALIISGQVDGGGRIFAVDNDVTSTCGSPVVGPCQLPDTDPAVGSLSLAPASFGPDLSVQASVQTRDVASGPGVFNRLDSTGTQVTNNGVVSHTFSIAVGATDFAGPSIQAFTTGAGQWSNLGGGFGDSSIFMRWFDDPLNRQGALDAGAIQPGDLIDTFADLAGPGNPDSFSHNGGPFAVNDPALFSMTLQFDGVIGPGVRLTGREQTELKPQVVPNAGTGWLMGLGAVLLGVVFAGRKHEHGR